MQEKVEKLTKWLGVQVAEAKAEGLIVGLSGGIDSAVTIVLCKKVCPDSTIGVIMPCHSDPQDAMDAQLIAHVFAIPVEIVVLDDVFDLLVKKLTGETCAPTVEDLSIVNIKPRLRMTTLYFFAARRKSLVVGTGNKSELTVGYFTKYGDGGVDLLPIGNLVKTEVREMARYLGVPQRIIDKPPSAGLWLGHDDEAEMGVTYDELDRCIMTGECSLKARKTIEELAKRSEHKKIMPLLPPF